MYGTTYEGGSNIRRTAFDITSAGTFITLCDFGSPDSDRRFITGSVALDSFGNLYGMSTRTATTAVTVWKLSSTGTLTVLHRFDWNDGAYPAYGDVKIDKQGTESRRPTTEEELCSREPQGGTFRVLYKCGGGSVGCNPSGGVREGGGILYGTTTVLWLGRSQNGVAIQHRQLQVHRAA